MASEPPFFEAYTKLVEKSNPSKTVCSLGDNVIEECELPVIDLSHLSRGRAERERCKTMIATASKELGFFQVVNHGISPVILERMSRAQVEVFKQPFEHKMNVNNRRFSPGTYRWGSPNATKLEQLCWSEAFHIPMTDINPATDTSNINLSSTIEQFAATAAHLAQMLSEILAEKLGKKSIFFQENCLPRSCYLRLNRYPPCPLARGLYGLMPHTDSDFLTVVHQDHVGGLQLVKDGKWFAVKPNPRALLVNLGDLFQAWSNNVYKSVEHRVVTNPRVERFSAAYFLCPSVDTVISSGCHPSVYRKFSFREYKQQVHEDVKKFGNKIGLTRFLQ